MAGDKFAKVDVRLLSTPGQNDIHRMYLFQKFMAEIGAAVVGGAFTLAAAGYSSGTGFTARHETTHAQQIAEMKRHISDFELAYERQEVTENDWERFLAIRADKPIDMARARESESNYEESIEAYKETPVYRFILKWKRRRQVRKKKKALRRANKSLRSHYYESTSDASDTSSTTVAPGSPPRSGRARSDEDDERIRSWANDVATSDSDDEPAASLDQSSGE
ncbi:hypothetical protein M413DRAFT_6717 [Hebeloma cylindrosporum]|uniref:Uncharacterized protein n=1 Tax=Hebeloma cylindrosporum TaxID=76867 RepID=A0A0C3D0F0_HEBCY|nr:hypothetical protein M413DRAFT_6717 [Hebeloma cylindrosporum h7]